MFSVQAIIDNVVYDFSKKSVERLWKSKKKIPVFTVVCLVIVSFGVGVVVSPKIYPTIYRYITGQPTTSENIQYEADNNKLRLENEQLKNQVEDLKANLQEQINRNEEMKKRVNEILGINK